MEPSAASSPDSLRADAPAIVVEQQRKYRTGILVVQWFNAASACYYFNYVFFYLKLHFQFGDGGNLTFSALYGLVYMLTAAGAGAFAYKHGYFKTLRLGFAGMAATMLLGGILPHVLGYTSTLLLLEWVILAVWTVSACCTWPTLQSLLSWRQSPADFPRIAGYYNMDWACANAVAYLTSGLILDTFGGEILFWVAGGMNLLQLALLPRLQKLETQIAATDPPPDNSAETLPPLNPRPIAKAKSFLLLAWVANPFAYVAIYGIMPVIPKLAQELGLTASAAGLICSVWFWTRLVAFAWFSYWPGWHYRFRWLLTAFAAMIGSFIAMLISPHIWILVVAQVVFGLAIGLIYYSSLFYSMDAGESKGKRGGFHEAAIGLGIFIGPATGVAAIHLFPQHTNAATWGMSALLVVGLGLFLAVRYSGRR